MINHSEILDKQKYLPNTDILYVSNQRKIQQVDNWNKEVIQEIFNSKT